MCLDPSSESIVSASLQFKPSTHLSVKNYNLRHLVTCHLTSALEVPPLHSAHRSPVILTCNIKSALLTCIFQLQHNPPLQYVSLNTSGHTYTSHLWSPLTVISSSDHSCSLGSRLTTGHRPASVPVSPHTQLLAFKINLLTQSLPLSHNTTLTTFQFGTAVTFHELTTFI